MSFEQENGYIPETLEEVMSQIRIGLNTEFGLSYTEESFLGTSWYKYFYALAQKVQKNEIKTAEIFNKLKTYISLTNERIQRPSVSFPGLIESFESQGWVASIKDNLIADAGTISICVDVDETGDDYAAEKLQINNLIKDFVVGGMVSQGTEVSLITLTNGQSFNFKYYLPDSHVTHLRLNILTSDNNLLTIPDDEYLRALLLENISKRYRLGWDFEPQRYFGTADAAWASSIILEWSHDAGTTWHTTIFQADFQDLFLFSLENTQILVT